uniref:Secreted protein n=1 Tax=Acrobeloides nanus TaxID=290746 RepID=A0A914C4W2_9BILA
MSVPFLVQISNALALLLTNRLVRKAFLRLVFRKSSNSQLVVTAFGNTASKTTRVRGYKTKTAAKLIQMATVSQVVGTMEQTNRKNGPEI